MSFDESPHLCAVWIHAVRQNQTSMKSRDFGYSINYRTRQIAVHGEVDLAAAPGVAAALGELQQHGVGAVTIGLDDVTFIDASGLGAFVSARSAQAARSSRLDVTGASPRIRRIFELGQLAMLLKRDTDSDSADLPAAGAEGHQPR